MNKTPFTLSALLLVLAAILFSACDSGTPSTPTPTANNTPGTSYTQADYDAAYAKWQALNVQEYNINLDYSAFSLLRGSWVINVANGKATATSFNVGGTPTTLPDSDLFILTVEGLFNTAARGLAQAQNPNDANYVYYYNITFDPDKGYPTSVDVRNVPNPINGSVVADTDYTVKVNSLEVVK